MWTLLRLCVVSNRMTANWLWNFLLISRHFLLVRNRLMSISVTLFFFWYIWFFRPSIVPHVVVCRLSTTLMSTRNCVHGRDRNDLRCFFVFSPSFTGFFPRNKLYKKTKSPEAFSFESVRIIVCVEASNGFEYIFIQSNHRPSIISLQKLKKIICANFSDTHFA